MNIGNFEIGAGKTFIIAETCSNIIPHLYNLGGVVAAVASTGADALKVQLYLADHFPEAERASKKRTEFPRDLFPKLVELCHEKGLACGASVFDEEAIRIVKESGGDFLKLATREWENDDLLRSTYQTHLPTIRSFDMNRLGNLARYWVTGPMIAYLSCWPEYPTGGNRPIIILDDNKGHFEGWSSHTEHWIDCIVAAARHTSILEKHIKFLANDYEAGWSLYPNEFQQMVKDIRWMEEAR